MKRVLLLVDAAGDFSYPELQDRTPLECARMSTASSFAKEGKVGGMRIRHAGPDSSRALLAEAIGFTSRASSKLRWGPLGVLAAEQPWEAGRVAYLAHFVHIDSEGHQYPLSPSSKDEQHQLLQELEQDLKDSLPEADVRMIGLSLGRFVITLSASHHWLSASPVAYHYRGFLQRLDPVLRSVLEQIQFFLEFNSLNQLRLDLGEVPISGVWCWSGGHRIPEPPSLDHSRVLVSPDPIVKGLASLCGSSFAELPDPYHPPTQEFPENQMQELLQDHDEMIVWLPALFASEEFQEPQEKVRRLDEMDYRLLAPFRKILENEEGVRLLLAAAGVRHRGRPERGTAPCLLWGSDVAPDGTAQWTESASVEGSLGTPRWSSLLETFRKSS